MVVQHILTPQHHHILVFLRLKLQNILLKILFLCRVVMLLLKQELDLVLPI